VYSPKTFDLLCFAMSTHVEASEDDAEDEAGGDEDDEAGGGSTRASRSSRLPRSRRCNRKEASKPTKVGKTPTKIEVGPTPTKGGSTRTKVGSTPTKGGSTQPKVGKTPTKGSSTPTKGGSTPTSEGSTKTKAGSTQPKVGSTPTKGSTPTGKTQPKVGSTPTDGGPTPQCKGQSHDGEQGYKRLRRMSGSASSGTVTPTKDDPKPVSRRRWGKGSLASTPGRDDPTSTRLFDSPTATPTTTPTTTPKPSSAPTPTMDEVLQLASSSGVWMKPGKNDTKGQEKKDKQAQEGADGDNEVAALDLDEQDRCLDSFLREYVSRAPTIFPCSPLRVFLERVPEPISGYLLGSICREHVFREYPALLVQCLTGIANNRRISWSGRISTLSLRYQQSPGICRLLCKHYFLEGLVS
jgi:hypothetical protein